MTGFTSKSKMAQDRLDDDDVQVYAKPRLDQGPDYERGFVDGMSKQAQSSVDRAVNRMAQPAQEPVEVCCGDYHKCSKPCTPRGRYYGEKLTPKRPWVGLTDEEISATSKGHIVRSTYARAIEAALKEKNFD
jgi:hypothetical protein